MSTNSKTPEVHTPDVPNVQSNIDNDICKGKDNQFRRNTAKRKVYNLLSSGGKYSVVELTKRLNIPDPRSTIRDLRNEGIDIADYWQKSEYSRYKIYFLHWEGGE